MNKHNEEVEKIKNEKGQVIAEIHGQIDVDILAHFFFKKMYPNTKIIDLDKEKER